jgi:hypothetical protein
MSEWQAARNLVDAAGENVRKVIRAFHGSPRSEHFDRFDPQYIGTGEGAQMYGYGHYASSRQPVGDWYRRNLSYGKLRDDFRSNLSDDADPDEVMSVIDSFDPRQQQFIRELANDDWLGFDYPSQAISQALGRRSGLAGYDASDELQLARDQLGTGYELEIDYPEESLLDWDALVRDQPVIMHRVPSASSLDSDATGYHLYDYMKLWHGGPRAASEGLLKEHGVPGIRYLDGMSRGVGEGTRNYVMFPGTEDRIRILRKYGLAPATLGAEGLLNQQPEESMAPASGPR